MLRTQIYLTDKQREELAAIARSSVKKQSEIIREVIYRVLEETRENRKEAAVREAAGMWKDRNDLTDFRSLWSEWER